ncbi:hypothetical protein PUNSTDRAFT_138805 [Punctularia strigosozonata HHB-11173 SS5]|uniref:RlpA-like protein double-psi beta-barrel domain-containing protein n=1 Tax=Punctularia strigosozonata (strain HHB-11173) TaxID=741275 RepID=R7S120_PUNST|nr:uncharacterized protein PUNSTDRAFT_138805 [Punctularia strigosozonata HHB-11173 SS5]EIN04075.1 hypothetical protein PUNSTDRAFT_138805 [Punctularia strigosozonata HHB-11173 SS5]
MFVRASVFTLAALVVYALAAPTRRTNTGDVTFFEPGLGACGQTNSASDSIVAISSTLFQSLQGATANPNANPVCGKTITANFQGKTATVTIVDACPGCAQFDLDFSPAAFSQLADPSVGRLTGVTWDFD